MSSAQSAFEPTDPVVAVDLLGGWNSPFNARPSTVPSNHEMFGTGPRAGKVSPISAVVGVPILIWRHDPTNSLNYISHPNRERLDNQAVTFLMINPYTGWAPAEWQQGIGRVTIARADKKPLSIGDLEMIWMFCDSVGEQANELGGDYVARRWYTAQAFQRWCADYAIDNPRNDRHLPL